MEESHSTVSAGSTPVERGLTRVIVITLAAIAVIVAAGTAAVLFRPQRMLTGYEIDIPVGMAPRMAVTSVAGLAIGYLDEQTPQLAAPELHAEPRILRVVATRASDVRVIEPAVPEASAMAAPDRLVWVVFGSGDFLNLRDHEWSHSGDPYMTGTIVVDDATGTILGVYPGNPPSFAPPSQFAVES